MARIRSANNFARSALVRTFLALLVLLLSSFEGGPVRLPAFAHRVVAEARTVAPVSETVGTTSRRQGNTEEQALRTVGGDNPSLTGDTEQDLRSQSGSLLAAPDSAWSDLTRDERAILLDGWVSWIEYEAAIADERERQALLEPVVEGAEALTGEEVEPQDLDVNAVVLELPEDKLGPALADEELEAIAIGPDVVLLIDDVVVAQIEAGADLVPDATTGEIDDRGLIVTTGSSPDAIADEVADDAEAAAPPVKYSAAGDPIPQITLEDLPPEAIDTLNLILEGGPFPFEQDGGAFGNFEGRLPAAEDGYYREYTVITPGEDDRGARRIVTGNADTEFYYTDDHYETFSEIVPSAPEPEPRSRDRSVSWSPPAPLRVALAAAVASC